MELDTIRAFLGWVSNAYNHQWCQGESRLYFKELETLPSLNHEDARQAFLLLRDERRTFPNPAICCQYLLRFSGGGKQGGVDYLMEWERMRENAWEAMVEIEGREARSIHEVELFDRVYPLFTELYSADSIPISAYLGCSQRVPVHRRRAFCEMAGSWASQGVCDAGS